MGRVNPNSKRGSVFLHWKEHGETSAAKFGEKKGVKPSRLRRWFKLWGTKAPTKVKAVEPERPKKKAKEATTTKEKPPSRVRASNKPIPKGTAVRFTWNQKMKGVVHAEGPEQSEVKFANGNIRVVVNNWIEEDT